MKDWITRESEYCAPNYHPLPVVISHGEGAFLWDITGKRYIDMMSAYSAVSFGHAHPRLLKVLAEQAAKLSVISRAFHCDTLLPFLEKLCTLAHLDMALPMNTGAEAVETAIKAARRHGYEIKGIPDNQAEIIVARDNFHGRTVSIISFSSDQSYKKHFGPLTPGFIEIPFGDAEALEKAITPNTCAFLVEPIQGEAGIRLPAPGWLKACEQICQKNKVLFILDEVQTGLGRTGKTFAFEHEGVQPDAVIVGKALGGGILPVSALVGRREILSLFTPGSHGSTFGGNALAARIGLEALRILEDEKLAEKSAQLGEILLSELSRLSHPVIKGVWGKGLWVGMEINTQKIAAREVCLKLMANGILSKEAHDTVVRFAPPLTIEPVILQEAIGLIKETILAL